MKFFKKNWGKLLILVFPTYCVVAFLFPGIYAFDTPADCLMDSSLLGKPACFIHDAYRFGSEVILLPITLLQSLITSAGGWEALGLLVVLWVLWAVVIYLISFVCMYLLLFKLPLFVVNTLRKRKTK